MLNINTMTDGAQAARMGTETVTRITLKNPKDWDAVSPWNKVLSYDDARDLLRWGWLDRSVGCVYVLALSNDFVKVGATKNPKDRLNEHNRLLCRHYECSIAGVYYTAPHTNYRANEMRVHRVLGRPWRTKEVYSGIKFSDAIEAARACEWRDSERDFE